ncbi:MAG: hypothetical protein ACRCR8_06235 [Snodgrassella alvi]
MRFILRLSPLHKRRLRPTDWQTHPRRQHRLIEVRIEKLNCTERYGYVYDALGRRIEKHQIDRTGKACNRTRFLWGRAENDSGNPY